MILYIPRNVFRRMQECCLNAVSSALSEVHAHLYLDCDPLAVESSGFETILANRLDYALIHRWVNRPQQMNVLWFAALVNREGDDHVCYGEITSHEVIGRNV